MNETTFLEQIRKDKEWTSEITDTVVDFAYWLEKRGDDRWKILRECKYARWEAIWLLFRPEGWSGMSVHIPYESATYMGEEAYAISKTQPVVAKWEELINHPDFESLPSSRAGKLLLAEWWGMQEVECERCEGEGEIHDADFSDGDSDRQMFLKQDTLRNCPHCNEGKVLDTRRRDGMRWLVENDYRPCVEGGTHFFFATDEDKPYFSHWVPRKYLGGSGILGRSSHYAAYHAAAEAVGKWLETERMKA